MIKDPSKMLELADACEQATGPDRELDFAILKAVGWSESQPYNREDDGWREPVDFTASIDAALMLVPGHCVWIAGDYKGMANATLWQGEHQYARGWASVSDAGEEPGDPSMPTYRVNAMTPALALCAASLRAKAAAAQ